MSERYNVPASDVLGENYKITSVECSDYNPAIDGTITVTISVNDVYGDAVSGESVTVTASEGTFTQLNGSDITSASSVTGTTNSSGQFTLTYNCSVWGLITFSANTTNTQIKVTGWKLMETKESAKVKVYANESMIALSIQDTFTLPANGDRTIATISSQYAPKYQVTTNFHPVNKQMTAIDTAGAIVVYNNTSLTTGIARVYVTYPLKARMV